MKDKIIGGLLGVCVGDALGLPVQFRPRSELVETPVTKMIGHGTFDLPKGSWSDDSSLTLCLVESLTNGLDYQDIGDKFGKWLSEGYMTPFGYAYDIGQSTRRSIRRLLSGTKAIECGDTGEYDNGNGSLMRMLPLAFYLNVVPENKWEVIRKVSSVTHAHPRTVIACSLYVETAIHLINNFSIGESWENAKRNVSNEYVDSTDEVYRKEMNDFIDHFYKTEEEYLQMTSDQIGSSGYVLDSLNASLWCLFTTHTYKQCVLRAVNLGWDTDTTAAIAGGLAGIMVGTEGIPSEWTDLLVKRKMIDGIIERFAESLSSLTK